MVCCITYFLGSSKTSNFEDWDRNTSSSNARRSSFGEERFADLFKHLSRISTDFYRCGLQ